MALAVARRNQGFAPRCAFDEHSFVRALGWAFVGGISMLVACESTSENPVGEAGVGGSGGLSDGAWPESGAAGISGVGGMSGVAGIGGVGGAVGLDASADGPNVGCNDGDVEQIYADDMVGCDGFRTHCEAEQLCSQEWHLCPFDEYVARGGDTVKPKKNYWLRSCVYTGDAGTLSCPTQYVCDACFNNQVVPTYDVTFACGDAGTGIDTATATRMGVAANPQTPERRVGCLKSACAFARAEVPSVKFGAVCCK